MDFLDITVFAVAALVLSIIMLKQQQLFGQIVRQNNKFVEDADKRLAKANEMDLEAKRMVSKLTESNDKLAATVIDIKDLMLTLREEYSNSNSVLVDNRDDYKKAYNALLVKFNEKDRRIEEIQNQLFNTVQEMARRPAINNNNKIEESDV